MMEAYTFFLFLLPVATAVSFVQNSSYEINNRERRDLLIRSKRRWVLSTIELVEEDSGPFPKPLTRMFNDKENLYNLKFSISGQGVTEHPLNLFSINDRTGEVYVHDTIDRENTPNFHVMFDVIDRATNEYVDKTLAFDVAVVDINDNPPEFKPPILHATVEENIKEGLLPVSLVVHDNDEPENDNSRISLRLVSQEPSSPKISLQHMEDSKSTVEQIVFTGCFDYDKAKTYKVLVEAKDHGTPSLSSTATITLDILDSNSHQPEFIQKSYTAQVVELTTNQEILRVGVTDKDTPNTPASKAIYTIVRGNEGGNYKIETDPETNEGVLTVIQAKDYETTTIAQLEISVQNVEPLFVCQDGKPGGASPAPNSVLVNVTVIDINDPPKFEKEVHKVYLREETEHGQPLYIPKVSDEDSDVNKIRYELVQDPANWVTIDKKTGVLTAVKKMDRESPFVKDSIYTVVIAAIDDGEPPATSSSTVLVHLGDQNDNKPHLVTDKLIMCGNKANSVNLMAADPDEPPYGGPFSFTIAGKDEELQMWRLDPSIGFNATLISLQSLAYGNYSIPLIIEDQQGSKDESTLHLTVCDCGGGDACRGRMPKSTRLGGAGIGTLIAGLLLLALILCLCFLCECRRSFKHIPINLQDEGNQTLIKYNEEGGSSISRAEPSIMMTSSNSFAVKDIMTQDVMPGYASAFQHSGSRELNGTIRAQGRPLMSSGGFQQLTESSATLMSQGQGMGFPTWVRSNTLRNGFARASKSVNMVSDQYIADHIDRRVCELDLYQLDTGHLPHEYAYEGRGSKCQSLDELSLSHFGDDLTFMQNLGPKFSTLGGICQQAIEEKKLKK